MAGTTTRSNVLSFWVRRTLTLIGALANLPRAERHGANDGEQEVAGMRAFLAAKCYDGEDQKPFRLLAHATPKSYNLALRRILSFLGPVAC